jgi:glycosyltransferase involved in cell wall biosynthesis
VLRQRVSCKFIAEILLARARCPLSRHSYAEPQLRKRGKIVLLHFAGQMPLAGIAWQAAHYLVALEKLGYEVWYVEDSGTNPYDPRVESAVMSCDYNLAHLKRAMERFGFGDRFVYRCGVDNSYYGLSRKEIKRLYGEADALINLCGAHHLYERHMHCPVRILIDTDPGYQQINYAKGDPAERAYIDAHTHFFTYGGNLGRADCPIPLSGIDWRPTRPPVDVDLWPAPEGEPSFFTSIASWDNRGKDIEYGGATYLWSKHVNFLKFLDIPERRPEISFRMAISPPNDAIRREVESHGWQLIDPRPVSADIDCYRDFIAGSRGEFTVAKDIYARTSSGWFSDRTVCYLASGRPVVTMRTGFDRLYPVGDGLFDFASHDEALSAIDAIASDYPRHARAARELAREYFAGERVVGALLAEVGL